MDNVLVRNEVTGAVWSFPCGKRLGKSVGDGALERVLPAERVGMKGGVRKNLPIRIDEENYYNPNISRYFKNPDKGTHVP